MDCVIRSSSITLKSKLNNVIHHKVKALLAVYQLFPKLPKYLKDFPFRDTLSLASLNERVEYHKFCYCYLSAFQCATAKI